eukprot:2582355-Pleurochrysis_carterae.AAC.1
MSKGGKQQPTRVSRQPHELGRAAQACRVRCAVLARFYTVLASLALCSASRPPQRRSAAQSS